MKAAAAIQEPLTLSGDTLNPVSYTHLDVYKRQVFVCTVVLLATIPRAGAEAVVEVPMLAAIQSNNLGVFEVLLLRWDHRPSPSPMELQWLGGNIRPGQTNLSSMVLAFQYALAHTPQIDHAGTVSAMGIAYAATGTDGPSAGAVMTVGFAALLKGDHIRRGIADVYKRQVRRHG